MRWWRFPLMAVTFALSAVAALLMAVSVNLATDDTFGRPFPVIQDDPWPWALWFTGLAAVTAFAAWWLPGVLERRTAEFSLAEARALLAGRVFRVETEAFHATLRHEPPIATTFAVGDGECIDLATLVDRVRDGRWTRLVVLGHSGAGKSVTCMEAILTLLAPLGEAATDVAGLIPVRVPAATWTAGRRLDDWLVERIELDYGIPRATADGLVRRRQVLPFIDGVDEMDPSADSGSGWPRAAALLEALKHYKLGTGRHPVVLTCRTDQYRSVAKSGPGLRPAGAVELTIRPLDPATIRRYVDERYAEDPAARRAWDGVLEQLGTPRGRVARKVLSTPWRLLLATTVVPARVTADTLLGRPKGGAADDTAADRVVETLLAQFIPATIMVAGDKLRYRGEDAARPALLDHRYLRTCPLPNPDRVARWLRALAGQQRRLQEAPDAPAVARSHLVPHLLWAVIPLNEMRKIHGSWAAWFGGAAAAVVILLLGKTLGITVGAAYALIVGVLVGLWVRRRCNRVPWPRLEAATSVRPRAGQVARAAVRGVLIGGVSTTLSVVPLLNILRNLGFDTPARVWPTALLAGLCCGVLAGNAGAMATRSTLWSIDANLDSPRRATRRAGRTQVINLFGRAGMTVAVYLAVGFPLGLSAGIGLLISLVLFLATESGMVVFRHYTGLLTAAAHGLLPWRAGRFLDWSATIGLLRFSGAAYQFRHRELSEWLARQPSGGRVTGCRGENHPG